MVKKWWIICLCMMSMAAQAQLLDSVQLSNKPLYMSMDDADTAVAEVYRLRIKRKLPADFAERVARYTHLQELHLVSMRLQEIPEVVYHITTLTHLDVSNNKIEHISPQIQYLVNLELLIINRNYLQGLPKEIQYLEHLTYLDMWSNMIMEFPQEISALESTLKVIDMRVINMSDARKAAMQALLPRTVFYFSPSCSCKY